MKHVQAGELDERVEIIRITQEPGADLKLTEARDSLGLYWAKVRPMSGSERNHAQQTQSRSNYLVIIRYREGISESDVIVWRGHKMNIRFIRDEGPRSRWLPIECERGAPQ